MQPDLVENRCGGGFLVCWGIDGARSRAKEKNRVFSTNKIYGKDFQLSSSPSRSAPLKEFSVQRTFVINYRQMRLSLTDSLLRFESCQYRSTDVILWHTDNSVHTRVVKAIDSNCPVFLPFFSFFCLTFTLGEFGGVGAGICRLNFVG